MSKSAAQALMTVCDCWYHCLLLGDSMQILAVVVRYKTPLSGSDTIHGLANTFACHPELHEQVGVLVWDNSPMPEENPRLPFAFTYRHSAENLGVSGAYNRAMEHAETLGCPWMLLLDQDTTLETNFLSAMLEYSLDQGKNEDIAAIVPFLFDGERPISPIAMGYAGNKPISPPFFGPYSKAIFAANSGTLMRVASLRAIGGYNESFWLDLSDVVVFHRLWTSGRRTFVAGDLHVQHKVTNNDYDGSMSPQRYRNFISAEGAFWDLYRTTMKNMIQTTRLFARAIRQFRRFRNKNYSKITFTFALGRLFFSRERRLAQWKNGMAQRNIPLVSEGRIVG
jgi:GT2 family glycosyltransferase